MKILHTGDLHLGKTICEHSIQDDQLYVLSLLKQELKKDNYTALIIAGDIYDRSIPPVEAVVMFSLFLTALKETRPELTILIIAGNHDSAKRIGYADRILERQGIYIGSDPLRSREPVILEKDGEEAAVYLLPFLTAGSILPEAADGQLPLDGPFKGQQDMVKEALRRIEEVRNPALPAILAAHLFTLGAVSADSERRFLGTAELVDPAVFRPFAYTALGHLHKSQRITDRVWYAGAPLAYSFDEAGAQKNFLKITINTRSAGFPVSVEPIPITPLRQIRRLSDSFSSFYTGSAYDTYREDFLELEFTDTDIIENPMALLRGRYPFLLNIKQQRALETLSGSTEKPEQHKQGNSIADEFSAFLTELYGNADPEKLCLFELLAGQEIEHEAPQSDTI